MKKIISVLVLLMFVATVIPLAVAQEETDEREIRIQALEEKRQERREAAGELLREEVQDLREEAKQELREAKDELVEEAKARARDRKEELAEKAKERGEDIIDSARDRAKSKLRDLHTNFKNIKLRHKDVQAKYKEHRKELADLRQKVKDCEGECVEEKQAVRRGVRNHLEKTIDVIDRSLEKLTNRVEASEKLSDEDKQTALTNIATLETRLTEAREGIAPEEMTNEDLKSAIRNLKALWQDVRKEQRSIVNSLISSKQDVMVEKLESIGERMLEKIASFEGDTAELEALHTEFEGHVANLKASNSMQEFREETQAAKEVLRKFVALTKG